MPMGRRQDVIVGLKSFPDRASDTRPYAEVLGRVNAEAMLILAGGRALLMQLAHPAVAAGVDEHSDFRHRPLERLLRTLALTLTLTFGERKEALAAAQAINRVHHGVHGPGYSA